MVHYQPWLSTRLLLFRHPFLRASFATRRGNGSSRSPSDADSSRRKPAVTAGAAWELPGQRTWNDELNPNEASFKLISGWFLHKKIIKHRKTPFVHLHPFTVCWGCSKSLFTISPIVLWKPPNPANVFQHANRLQSTCLRRNHACPFCRVSCVDLSSISLGDHGWNIHTIAYSYWYRSPK